MDLEKFFDTVSHSKLIEVLSKTIKDGRVISLIHKYLNAGVMTEGRHEPSEQGVPQGGPLSPLLGNIMLNELDRELERRGHKFVRYADDMVILCKSKRSAERTMKSIIPFIEGKLFLKVNREKNKMSHVRDVKFLGYSFYVTKGEGRLRMVIWKQWKRIRTKCANLIRLGIPKSKAWEWANTRKGYWHCFLHLSTLFPYTSLLMYQYPDYQ